MTQYRRYTERDQFLETLLDKIDRDYTLSRARLIDILEIRDEWVAILEGEVKQEGF